MKIAVSCKSCAISLAVLSATLAPTSTAWGQTTESTTTTTSPAPAPVVVEQAPVPAQVATTTTTAAPVLVSGAAPPETREEGYAPNRFLLVSGIIVSAASYGTAVIVAAQSNNDADHHLYVPIVGPWIDMGNRAPCSVSNTGCDTETTNKVLLGIDGAFQAIGALELVGAFLSPEKKRVTTVPATAYTPELTLQPAKVGGSGYGLVAFARF